jgi:hypothetical protein
MTPEYHVRYAETPPPLDGPWDGPDWSRAETAEVAVFQPQSTHRPRTRVRALYTADAIHLHWLVEDQYVLSTRTGLNSYVWNDACVEFFVQPKPGMGHMNFEMNCGGHLLSQYIEDPTRAEKFFNKFTWVPEETLRRVRVVHSLPETVDPEITEPVTWTVAYTIPFSLFEEFVGPLGEVVGQTWRANFNKCACDNSHPHWATWAPVDPPGDFHQPKCFAPVHFVPPS